MSPASSRAYVANTKRDKPCLQILNIVIGRQCDYTCKFRTTSCTHGWLKYMLYRCTNIQTDAFMCKCWMLQICLPCLSAMEMPCVYFRHEAFPSPTFWKIRNSAPLLGPVAGLSWLRVGPTWQWCNHCRCRLWGHWRIDRLAFPKNTEWRLACFPHSSEPQWRLADTIKKTCISFSRASRFCWIFVICIYIYMYMYFAFNPCYWESRGSALLNSNFESKELQKRGAI